MGFIGYSLSQLAEETGVEMRTIRHYISIGILPPPSSRGRGARYDQVHLDRLKAIRVLQRDHKLDEIREILSSISPEELQQHISDWILEKPKNDLSARDYLNSVENQFRNSKREYRNLQMNRKLNPSYSADFNLGMERRILNKEDQIPIDRLILKLEEVSGKPPKRTRPGRRWDVIEILPGVELHVREQHRYMLSRLERVCDYIRHILTGAENEQK